MFAIEEIVQNNLRNGAFPNPNIIKILNVKYLISPQQLNQSDLQLVKFDDTQKLYTYLIKNYSKRGYFVPAVNLITDEFERVKELNNPLFKPDSVAIIETELSDFIEAPDSNSVEVTFINPNERQFKIFTDKQALFVISELYFPPGWKTYLDGEQLATEKIYKTNHAIQSIVVPVGKHIVDLKFEPDSYADNVLYASGSLVLLYLVIASSVVTNFIKKKKDS